MKKVTAGLLGVLLLTGTAAFAVDSPFVVAPSELKWQPIKDMPGAEVALISGDPSKQELYTARIRLPANFKIQAHTHPTNEYDTIITGALFVGEGSTFTTKGLEKISAGSVVVFPAGVAHFSMTKQPTILQISGIGPWGTNYLNGQGGQQTSGQQTTSQNS